MFEVGRCYATGKGVEEDMKQAMWYTLRSAELNYHPAQCLIGMLYKSMNDLENAGKWLLTASRREQSREVPYRGAIREFGKLVYEVAKKRGDIEQQADGLHILITAGQYKDQEAEDLAYQIVSTEDEVRDILIRRGHPEDEENVL